MFSDTFMGVESGGMRSGGCRISPRRGRPVMDWCINAIESCIFNGETPPQEWAPAPERPPPGSAPDASPAVGKSAGDVPPEIMIFQYIFS